jgi:hypothetical protein
MTSSVFAHVEFWLLVVFSLIVPTAIYVGLLSTRAISRVTVLVLGLVLVAISGLDVYLLQRLENEAKATPSLADDRLFQSELTFALYLLPLLFAGVGVNMVSHVLIEHLAEAERKYDEEQPKRARIRLRVLRPQARRPQPPRAAPRGGMIEDAREKE